MSVGIAVAWPQRMLAWRWWRVAVLALLIAAAVVVSAIVTDDVPDAVNAGTIWIRHILHRYTYLAGFGLLYIEESGIPLPAPGDVFVMYVGAHVPRYLAAWVTAWIGLISVVVLGATNLFFISKRYGRRLAEGRLGAVVHLSPERLRRAEGWFERYGAIAIIFGRHIPGFRVPITVAAGICRVPYRVFALSVAISTAVWAGAVILIGISFGGRMEAFLRLHRETYWLWAAAVLVMVGLALLRVRRWSPATTNQP
jgi:membrane protein DedA with SNARE-associated domain